MLKVQGSKIVDGRGREVVLRGYNVGNWMMMENFMLGFPGTEEEFRSAVRRHAGNDRYEFFFDRFLHHFLNEKDIEFIKGIGMNSIRIPFNYRHFESDARPYAYDPKAFERMDRILDACRRHGVYAILDLHAAQGYQSVCWHCDNNGFPARIFTHATERDRFCKLWTAIAERYAGDDIVAGYDLINEPDALTDEGRASLNALYRDAVAAVRAVDKDHIIFIAGDRYNKDFDCLEPPFAENLAYTPHYYLAACTSTPMRYPGEIDNITYDRRLIEHQMDSLDAYMRRHGVPCWVGEFGVRLSYPGYTEDRLRAFGDQLDCINRRGHHYSIWSYKDIGYLSTVAVKPDSPWMVFADDVIELKKRYFVDKNFRVNEDWGISSLLGLKEPAGMDDRYGRAKDAVVDAMKTALATELADRLGRKFADLDEGRLEALAASFAFENCAVDSRRLEVIKKYGLG